MADAKTTSMMKAVYLACILLVVVICLATETMGVPVRRQAVEENEIVKNSNNVVREEIAELESRLSDLYAAQEEENVEGRQAVSQKEENEQQNEIMKNSNNAALEEIAEYLESRLSNMYNAQGEKDEEGRYDADGFCRYRCRPGTWFGDG